VAAKHLLKKQKTASRDSLACFFTVAQPSLSDKVARLLREKLMSRLSDTRPAAGASVGLNEE
jgi:hypothetical protein